MAARSTGRGMTGRRRLSRRTLRAQALALPLRRQAKPRAPSRARERRRAKAQTFTLALGENHVPSSTSAVAGPLPAHGRFPVRSDITARLRLNHGRRGRYDDRRRQQRQVYQWSGCYAGINGGGGTSASNFTTTVDPGTYLGAADAAEVNNDGTGSANISAFVGGGQVGCNWQSGTVVAGLEGDFDYFHSTSAFFNNTNMLPVLLVPFTVGQSLTTNYLATVRPRIGIAADRNFAYVTGGVAFTTANYTESYSDGSAPPGVGIASASKFLTGWTAGAGWEYALTRSLAGPVRISVRGVPENERVGRDYRTRSRNQHAARLWRPRHADRPRRHELQVLSVGSPSCVNPASSSPSPAYARAVTRLRRGA